MKRCSGSTRRSSTQCSTTLATSRCRSLSAPIPTATSISPFSSLNSPISRTPVRLGRFPFAPPEIRAIDPEYNGGPRYPQIMPAGSRYEVFDRSRLRLKPLAERRNDLQLDRWISLDDAAPPFTHPDLPII